MEDRGNRPSALFIDCAEDDFDHALAFWAGAFGVEPDPPSDPASPYYHLSGGAGGLTVSLQRIGSPGRYHIDFPAADVEAEVQRFEALGAERVEFVEYWWVMRAPTGHLFCVVPEGDS